MLQVRNRAISQVTQPRQDAGRKQSSVCSRPGWLNRRASKLALEALYQELTRNRDEATLEEVEQLLLIANQQLQLAGNVKAALIAMQEADARLQRIDRPQLTPLRKILSKDMDLLKAAPYVDTVGISVRLDNLAAAVDQLPLAMELRPRKRALPVREPARAKVLG